MDSIQGELFILMQTNFVILKRIAYVVLKNKNLVTTRDLAELKLELLKCILGTGIAVVLAIAGLLKYLH